MLNTPLSNAEHTETETSGEPSKNLFQRNNTSNALTISSFNGVPGTVFALQIAVYNEVHGEAPIIWRIIETPKVVDSCPSARF